MPEEVKPKKKYHYERSTFTYQGKQYSATGKTQREADRKAAEKLILMKRAEITSGGNMTVAAWAEMWLETYKANAKDVGYAQYKNLQSYIRAINVKIGTKRLKDVTPEDIQSTLNYCAVKHPKGKKPPEKKTNSTSYVLHIKQTLHSIFRRAYKSRHIPYDPSEDLIMPASYDSKGRALTDSERAVIMPLAEMHHAGLWIKLIYYCGLRPAETRALNWGDIDFDARMIRVTQSVKAKTEDIGAPKTEAGIRNIPIPPPLYTLLLASRGAPDEPVITQPTTGKRHTASSLGSLWHNFLRTLDISLGAKLYRNQIIESKIASDLVPYCLRHTYGTDLQTAGVPINVAKYLLGHSDVTTTANIYTHASDEILGDTAQRITDYHNKQNITFNM
jgi:integrase